MNEMRLAILDTVDCQRLFPKPRQKFNVPEPTVVVPLDVLSIYSGELINPTTVKWVCVSPFL